MLMPITGISINVTQAMVQVHHPFTQKRLDIFDFNAEYFYALKSRLSLGIILVGF